MYPKQIFIAQSIYNKYKKDLTEINISIKKELKPSLGNSDIEDLYKFLVTKDIGYVANKLNVNLDYESSSPELIFIMSFISYLTETSQNIKGLQGNDTQTKAAIYKYYESAKDSNLPVGYILKNLPAKDEKLRKSYTGFILEFSQSVVAADKDINSFEIEGINILTNQLVSDSFGDDSKFGASQTMLSEKHDKKLERKSTDKIQSETLSNILEELDAYTGMEGIKKDVRTLINMLKIQKQRENQGLSVVKPSLHMVFTGPPGTGKTTIARIMGRIFKSLGVLDNGHMIETDRSGLVAGYVGQTAIKVDEVVNSARNGVLFIDEAYTLAPAESQDSFGQEAIDTLLKRMEDMRESLVVIAAGYEEEMQRFIDSNPGFKSRFNRYINFIDYSPDELIEIFKTIVKKNHYIASEELINLLHSEFKKKYESRDRSFGNGRYARNIFEKTIENQSNRLASIDGDLSNNELQLLTAEDFPA